MSRKIPSKLYKYQPYTTWSLDNLKDRRLWFSKPSEFNDPFDCAIDLDIAEMSEDEWRIVYEKKVPSDLKYLNNGAPNELVKENFLLAIRNLLNEQKEKMLNNKGVACFAERVDNLLLWSHYADKHRGFCLEFDTEYEPFRLSSKIFPVKYSDKTPIFNPFGILFDKDSKQFIKAIRTKSCHWAYEEEWRIFHKKGNHEYGIEPEALTGVYFGSMMPYAHKEIISLILRDSPTSLYEMHKEKGKFQVSPRQVNYKPYDYSTESA